MAKHITIDNNIHEMTAHSIQIGTFTADSSTSGAAEIIVEYI